MADMIGVRKQEEGKKGAPAYIVSFSALMTIMLTFFILLCTMANEQEYGLLGAGTGSFIHNINALGLPGLLPGHRTTIDLGPGRPGYLPLERAAVQTDGSDADVIYRRVISIEPIRLPRALASYFRKEKELHMWIYVDFEPGSAFLTKNARRKLWPLLTRIRMMQYHVRVEAYVDERFSSNEIHGNAWELSAARAAAVVRYFHQAGGMSYRRMWPVGHGSAKLIAEGPINDRLVRLVLSKY
ncbi:MAG: OmpA family protein [Planctomycetes bacterium]|nr:OmpA family protein [Planctomycetota bacterium]